MHKLNFFFGFCLVTLISWNENSPQWNLTIVTNTPYPYIYLFFQILTQSEYKTQKLRNCPTPCATSRFYDISWQSGNSPFICSFSRRWRFFSNRCQMSTCFWFRLKIWNTGLVCLLLISCGNLTRVGLLRMVSLIYFHWEGWLEFRDGFSPKSTPNVYYNNLRTHQLWRLVL